MVSVAVHEAASGDELYLQAVPVEVAGRYDGPGNNNPRISTTEVRVNENAGDELTAAGSKIGAPVSATDADNEDASLKYGIEPVSSQFGIGTSDGQVTLKADTNFDYEGGTREYTLTVKVEDPDGGSVKGEVKVSIADINEVPELGEIGSRRAIIGHEFEMTFAPATDEDAGQSHTYSASLADGGDLPTWLVFAGSDRKFTIGSDASGITAATYQISVDVADSGTPQLSASRVFALTVVEAGRIESGNLEVFSRASPQHDLSVRLSAGPKQKVTISLSVSDAAAISTGQLTFGSSDWNAWQTVQVSLSAATTVRKEDLNFVVSVAVHEAASGDELYLQTAPMQVAGRYEGPGNKNPRISEATITINENAGNEQSVAGSKIGAPVSATDEDNEDASLKYLLEPVSSQFGIGTSDGQVTLKAAVNFNYEGGPREYTLTVKVEDPEGGNVKGEVKISIADINEAPELGEIGSRRAIIGHEFEMTFDSATDEDAGQSHIYSASLADGGDLPTWLVFAGSDRKFTIGSGASGITAATYQISVSATDDGSPQLSASRVFALTVVEAGRIESTLLPVFSRAGPQHDLSVRLSAGPKQKVTISLSVSDAAALSIRQLIFGASDWNAWQTVQVSLSAATTVRKDDLDFVVSVAVHEAASGDELYLQTVPVEVAGRYDGPGNIAPRISTTEVRVNENAGDELTTAGSKIGLPVSATDADNEDASLKYVLEPVSSQFGIGTSDGQITLKVDTNFNHEGGTRTYTVTVKVEDPEGGSASARVQISIADINEAPQLEDIKNRRAIIGHEFEMEFDPATDEDAGQSHTYSASLADGGDLPTWLVFAGSDRKFTIGSDASGITAATYQISVSAIDDGSPQLSASRVFALTVVEAGRIESGNLAVFSRTSPQHDLSVRLSAGPKQEVTISLSVSDAAALSTGQLTFGSSDWNVWQTVQVSLSAATTMRKEDLDFVVLVAVHEAASGDELYLQTVPVEVSGRYEGPGNKDPRISEATITINENAGNEQTTVGSKIGAPVSATDEDNDEASLKYALEPVSSQFGIGTDDGQITLKAAVNFDYEGGTREYILTVKVEDPDEGSASAQVQISIVDINETPQLKDIKSQRAIIGHEFEMTFDPATDEDTGQNHTYSASLTDGDLPTWLVFAGSDRKFTIGSGASGITAATYQISVSATDDGSPPLSASRVFALTVVEAGRIESGNLAVFSRAGPQHDLSVRLSAKPVKKVTISLSVSDAAALSTGQLTFGSSDWNVWQTVQVSLSAATTVRKDDLNFVVSVAVHEAALGDELYLQTVPVEVAGRYDAPGNIAPRISTTEVRVNENAGDEQTVAGSKIGTPVSATDEDNEDASLKYVLEPVSSQFGIGTSDGQISLKVDTNFDYEGGPREYTLTVKVEDPEGGSVKGEVKISIADINEAPELGEIGSRRAIIGHEFEMTVAPATDEDTGQSHTYSASLADGGDLPTWLVFAGSDRKFTIGSDASGITAATYQISVDVADNGSPPLSASRVFALTVVEAGRIESDKLEVFSRAGPQHDLIVRLSASPKQKVTISLSVSDAAALSIRQLIFGASDWNAWQTVQVSLSAATTVRKDDLDFVVSVAVHEAASGDELYLQTVPVEVAGRYDGPGNIAPRISTTEVRVNENAGDELTAAGSKIGTPVSATDADNEDASLKYTLEPADNLFGILTDDGQITLKVDTNFNHEGGTRTYTVTVKVEDPEGGSASARVQISIADINEAPQLEDMKNRRAIIGRSFALTIAAVIDEDVGQTHSYAAALADGSALPLWLEFAAGQRKFSIAAAASGVEVGAYSISVSATDDGSPQLSASRVFALTVVEAGRIESTLLPVFSRASPQHDLSVRLSAGPKQKVTISLSVSDAAALSTGQLTFGSSDWNAWQTVQVSLSAATTVRKEDLNFVVSVAVHEAASGDELYLQTVPVEVSGRYEGPGNKDPRISEATITINENAGNEQSVAGSKIGAPVSATDEDNDEASLKYTLEPADNLFGILTDDGQITLKVDTNFNHEGGTRTYTVTVKVEDPDEGSASAQVQISIVDINETPQLKDIKSQRAIIGHEFEMTFDPATDEDAGQSHIYSASLADGGDLPTWLVFAGSDRKFTIGSDASGITAATYQISVDVVDSGTPQLSASQVFALTVVEAGRIESGNLPVFSRTSPQHDLSVRLSAGPKQEVTISLSVSDAAAISTGQLIFGSSDWNVWQTVQVSLSAATTVRKEDLDFVVSVAVHEAASGDELYLQAVPVEVAGRYDGPGNNNPRISTTEVRVNENAGDELTVAGSKIGTPVSATDADNEDASLKYGIEPVSSQFGIGTSDGQISLKVDTNFDYEDGTREYTLTVKVEDPEGGRVKGEVKISIADINEAPELGEIGSRRAIIGHEFEMMFDPATDEDAGQSHIYSASLADGGDLPTWLIFAGTDRKFTIGSGASGITAATYQISVDVADSGTPQLSASRVFALTVVEAGRIESGNLAVFSRASPQQELSVRLSAGPKQEVTISLSVSDAAALSTGQLTFGSSDWNVWQTVQVSLSAATTVRKEGLDFVVSVAVHEAASGDELYLQAVPVEVAGRYDGPGNKKPRISEATITINENAGAEQSVAGSKIGAPVSATDADNEDASLKYTLEPADNLFGILTDDGQITLKVDTNFNHEGGTRTYTVTVKAEDPDGGSASARVQISIADINEAPQLEDMKNRRAIIGSPLEIFFSEAVDEDAGQMHVYDAALAGGDSLPGWIDFSAQQRRFVITARTAGEYQISVSATDDGEPPLSASEGFVLTVVEPGHIEIGELPAFSRASPQQELSVRLSAGPKQKVTISLSVSDAAALSTRQLTFGSSDWNVWQAVQVSVSAATQLEKGVVDFIVTVGVRDSASSDELYENAGQVIVQGKYVGPGNRQPQVSGDAILLEENAGSIRTPAGTKIGAPVSATDEDNEDALLTYSIEPVSGLFGISTGDGQITLKADTNFNYEAGPRAYSVTVVIRDPDEGRSTVTVDILIEDVNEAPELAAIEDVRAIIGRPFALTVAGAVDEDTGQTHSYAAALADGSVLPLWLEFVAGQRKFSIAAAASGVEAGVYPISVSATDDGSPPLSASENFVLTVVEPGHIEAGGLPDFSRASPQHGLSVRLSAGPKQKVTISLSVSDAAALSTGQLTFGSSDWNVWQTVQVSLSAATTVRKDDLNFVVSVAVHEAASGDELYLQTAPVEVAGRYDGPGNIAPRISTTEVRVNENAGDELTTAGSKIGLPVSATDADNEDASLKYVLEPVSSLFGISTDDGQVTLKVDTNFNHEGGTRTYTVTVKVEDPEGGSASARVQISIADINEAPQLEDMKNRRAILRWPFALVIAGAVDEDVGQTHSYAAALADGSALPLWLEFVADQRKFSIASGASGVEAGVYRISVSATDDGTPELSAYGKFNITVVEPGRIEVGALPDFSRAQPSHDLSVRLSARPGQAVTLTVSVSDAATVARMEMIFVPERWDEWQAVRVSITPATAARKDDLIFSVMVEVLDLSDGDGLFDTNISLVDILYRTTPQVTVQGRYEGPGNKDPRISEATITINENAGAEQSVAGSKIGAPVSATDEDNDEASLKYALEPTSSLFGIGTGDGQITLKVDTNFNHEGGTRTYTVTVKAEDPDGGSASARVQISIADINEAPQLEDMKNRRAIIGSPLEIFFSEAVDEDAGQMHVYDAALAGGDSLPGWIDFSAQQRRFVITARTAGEYRISVSATDDGEPPLSASEGFVLTVVEPGHIEAGGLPDFSRASPQHGLSVRLSAGPKQEVTVSLSVSDAAALSTGQLIFGASDWNVWQAVQVSLSAATTVRKDDLDFVVSVAVHEAASGDELYLQTVPVEVSGRYNGPGNIAPRISTTEVRVNENAGDELTAAGSKIGAPVSATDADNEDASLKYVLEPVSSLFGISTDDGQVTLKVDTNFNHEGGTRTYTVTVKVEDPEGGSASARVQISIADINEAPQLEDMKNRRAIIGRSFALVIAGAVDEDVGQTHSYAAALADGSALPLWLEFVADQRKFSIASGASGVEAGVYRISVSATDDGTPELSAYGKFNITVVEPGRIEVGALPDFSRAQPSHDLSVRLSARPGQAVTLTVSVSDAATVARMEMIFVPERWDEWQAVRVSITPATAARKDDLIFSVMVEVLDLSDGDGLFDTNISLVDILYRTAGQVIVQGQYVGPGNRQPQVSGDAILLEENAGSIRTPAGTKIGAPVSATDEDNEDALLAYSIDPVSGLFGISTGDGQISLKADTNFNYEAGPRAYSVTVVIRDPDEGRSTVTVDILIEDVNEAPELAAIEDVRAIIGRSFALTVAGAVDEDTGQRHSYAAALADGSVLPLWLEFAAGQRKFSIAAAASGVEAGVYPISVSAIDDGSPPLSASENFVLTVVEPGHIEAGGLPDFSRASPQHDLSVRLGAAPDREVTLTLSVADAQAAAVAPAVLRFKPAVWNEWQAVRVSLSAATTVRKEDLDFVVSVAVHEAASGDELYANASPVQVAGRYDGPGNADPRLSTDEIVLNENSGDSLKEAGVPVGEAVLATDPDNDDASLKYAIEPAASLFGIEGDSGQITLKADTNFNYETGQRFYTVTVKVDDPEGGSVSARMRIRIADINEMPSLPAIADQQAVIGNDFSFVFAPATDDDVGQTHSYVVRQAGGEPRPAWLLFSPAPRRLDMAGADARVEEGEYFLEVIASDSGSPTLRASRSFRLHVLAGGQVQAQPITGMSAQKTTADLLVRISVQPQGAVTITLTSRQPQVADVEPAALVFGPGNWNVYQSVTVRAAAEVVNRDESADYALVLAVHEASAADSLYREAPPLSVPGRYYGSGNEAPTVQPLTVSIYENRPHELTPAGTFIGQPVAVFDPDHGVRELAYRLIDDSGLFEIESPVVYRQIIAGRSDSGTSAAPGQLRLRRNYGFDYEARDEYRMTVLVHDPAGGQARAMVKVGIIELPEQDNQAPHLAATVFYMDENVGEEQTPAGTAVGTAISAEDADNRSDEITYSIIGSSDIFRIGHAGGTATIVTGRRMHFDYEAVPAYALTIGAMDPHGAVGVATISIVLNDLAEEFVENANERDDASGRQPLLIGYVDRAINAAVVAMVRQPSTASRTLSPEQVSGSENPWAGFGQQDEEALARAKPFEALLRHDFEYTLAGGGRHGSIAKVWSGGSRTSLNAAYFSDDLSYDGSVSTGIVGFEIETAARGRRIGMAASFSDADFDFVVDGDSIGVERDMFMLYPYIYWDVTPKARVWGLLGLGSGNYLSKDARESHKAKMLAFDGGIDYKWEYDDFDLALGLESSNTSSWLVDNADAFDESGAKTFRTRALFEVARPFSWAEDDFTLRPFARVQARLDRGDAGKKAVADFSGGARLHWGAGLQIDLDGTAQIRTRESRETSAHMAIAYDFANDGHGLLLEMDSSVEGGGADGHEFGTRYRVGSRIGWGRPTRFFGAAGDMVVQVRTVDDAVSDWGWSFQARKFGFSLLFKGASEATIRYSYQL